MKSSDGNKYAWLALGLFALASSVEYFLTLGGL